MHTTQDRARALHGRARRRHGLPDADHHADRAEQRRAEGPRRGQQLGDVLPVDRRLVRRLAVRRDLRPNRCTTTSPPSSARRRPTRSPAGAARSTRPMLQSHAGADQGRRCFERHRGWPVDGLPVGDPVRGGGRPARLFIKEVPLRGSTTTPPETTHDARSSGHRPRLTSASARPMATTSLKLWPPVHPALRERCAVMAFCARKWPLARRNEHGQAWRTWRRRRVAGMAADIAEQPAVLARLLDPHAGPIAAVARRIAERRPRNVVFTARGTSDHAALYGAYLTEIRLGIPAGLASPQRHHRLRRPPRPRRRLVVGVSPERRLARPDRGAPGGAGAGRAHARRHQQARTRRWPRPPSCPSTSRPGTSGRSPRPRPTPPSCWRCCCWSRAYGRAARCRPRSAGRWTRCRSWPSGRWPTPRPPSWPRATGSPPGWSPPAGGTPTRPPGRPR